VRTCLELLDSADQPDGQLVLQAGHYLFLLGEFGTCAGVLRKGLDHYPGNLTILLAFGLALSRAQKHPEALTQLHRYLELGGKSSSCFDGLATSSFALGNKLAACHYGSQALLAKDSATKSSRGKMALNPVADVHAKRRVIAFSLWGKGLKYLRGALHNVVAAREIYPGWTCRFIVDASVDETFLALLREEGAEVIVDTSGDDSIQHRLTRRFSVADDADVGHFLVRDCDSVVSPREAAAVREWLDSGLPFHVMRDWWSHTDPILAGLWGGTAGAFPNLMGTIAAFRSTAPETSNWDQWFLREHVWPAIRDEALIHDRLFASHRARPWPLPDPEDGSHVGQNEFAVSQAAQAELLQSFAERAPMLKLPMPVKLQFRTR